MVGEKLVLVIHPEAGQADRRTNWSREIAERNRRLLNYKRISGYLAWDRDFPLHRVAENQTRRAGRTDSPDRRPLAVVPL